MTLRQKIGTGLIASGLIAGLGNWLWLVGIVARPNDDLMTARWIYEAFIVFIGAFVGWAP